MDEALDPTPDQTSRADQAIRALGGQHGTLRVGVGPFRGRAYYRNAAGQLVRFPRHLELLLAGVDDPVRAAALTAVDGYRRALVASHNLGGVRPGVAE